MGPRGGVKGWGQGVGPRCGIIIAKEEEDKVRVGGQEKDNRCHERSYLAAKS